MVRAFVSCSFKVDQLNGDGYSQMVAEPGPSPFSLGEDVMSRHLICDGVSSTWKAAI